MTSSRWSALHIRDFRILLIARLTSSTALLIQAVIVGWQVYQLRPDPLLLGLIGLTEAIPAIGCSFISGHLVDTYRPSLIYRLSLFVLFLNGALLFLAVAPFMPFTDITRIVLLFLAVFISGAARSFASPAMFTMVPQIVSRAMIGPASAWTSTAYQFASIAGPAIGGLAYGEIGPLTAFALPACFQGCAFIASASLSAKTQALQSQSRREPIFRSIQSGLKYTFRQRVLLSTMTLDMFSVFFGGAVSVLPIYADQILHVGSQGLGFLRAAPSVGSAIVAIVIALSPVRAITGRKLLIAVAGFGIFTLAFAISTNFYLSLFFLMLTGAFDGVSMVIRSTILQLLTPDGMRGRVSSVSSVFITSSNEIGAFESGVAAQFMGLVPSVVFGGIMTLVIVGATAWMSPSLRKTSITHDSPPPVS